MRSSGRNSALCAGEPGDELRYVFRHLPLADVHQRAQLAAEAAEAAHAQGACTTASSHAGRTGDRGPGDAETLGRAPEGERERRMAAAG